MQASTMMRKWYCNSLLQISPCSKINNRKHSFIWKPDSFLMKQKHWKTMASGTKQMQRKDETLLLEILRGKVRSGELLYDVAQEKAAKRLTRLQKALYGYSNENVIAQIEKELEKQRERNEEQKQRADISEDSDSARDSPEAVIATKNQILETPRLRIPRGLFIHGNVGIGKSFLMDLFFENIPIQRKKRVHFHSFMQDVHQRIYKLKQEDLQTKGRNFTVDTSSESNPILRVGIKLADELALLCFDEFHVTDVADALILAQLFSVLFQRGTVVVATSNRHPSTLYEGGLNRGYFLPFIDLLCQHCIIHSIDASVDYRTLGAEGFESYFFSSASDKKVNSQYNAVLSDVWDKETSHERTIHAAFNRTINVETSKGGNIAKFTFGQLCNMELGSSDYRAIAQNFDLIIIEDLPQLSLKEPDQARRFITLVDELYEARCSLLCHAASDPDNLFIGRTTVDWLKLTTSCISNTTLLLNKNNNDDGYSTLHTSESAEDVDVGETLGIDVAQSNGVAMGELASVRELSFAFRRAASRLKEMSSRKQWENNGII